MDKPLSAKVRTYEKNLATVRKNMMEWLKDFLKWAGTEEGKNHYELQLKYSIDLANVRIRHLNSRVFLDGDKLEYSYENLSHEELLLLLEHLERYHSNKN